MACCEKKGNQVVAGERYKSKRRAEKEAEEWNRAYEGSGKEFLVRKEG